MKGPRLSVPKARRPSLSVASQKVPSYPMRALRDMPVVCRRAHCLAQEPSVVHNQICCMNKRIRAVPMCAVRILAQF